MKITDTLEVNWKKKAVQDFTERMSPAVVEIVRHDLIQSVGNAIRFRRNQRVIVKLAESIIRKEFLICKFVGALYHVRKEKKLEEELDSLMNEEHGSW